VIAPPRTPALEPLAGRTLDREVATPRAEGASSSRSVVIEIAAARVDPSIDGFEAVPVRLYVSFGPNLTGITQMLAAHTRSFCRRT
jgi:hypothetical protein